MRNQILVAALEHRKTKSLQSRAENQTIMTQRIKTQVDLQRKIIAEQMKIPTCETKFLMKNRSNP